MAEERSPDGSQAPTSRTASEVAEGRWFMHFAKCLAWVLALALPALAWSRWGPSLEAGTPESDLMPWFRSLAIYYSAFLLGTAWIVGRAGWLTLRSGRYPYPGQWSPMAVSRNPWWVKFNAGAYFAAAVALVWLLVAGWIELEIAALLGLVDFAPAAGNNCLE